jgi:Fur family transcriptional regulator, ferric uptake regulator
MTNTHEQEKKQFRRLFQQQGIDRFDSRFSVLDAFLKLEHHVSIQDLMKQLQADDLYFEQDFVLGTMNLLCRFGFATRNEFHDKEVRFEHLHLGLHHDHMICTKCGTILEFRDEVIEKQQIKAAEAYGFHMLQHKMEIYGICAKCLEDSDVLIPLHKAKKGDNLIIMKFEAGKSMHGRIVSMGLKIGDKIEIVSSGFGGQVVIADGENRLVLGRGMAEKIWVKRIDPASASPSESERISKIQTQDSTMLLSQMKTGQKGIVKKISGEGIVRRRLLEMGINRGTGIYVEKYAPLMDPIEIVLKGYHMYIRVEEAANILVENVRNRD